jgi:hypothetical protein
MPWLNETNGTSTTINSMLNQITQRIGQCAARLNGPAPSIQSVRSDCAGTVPPDHVDAPPGKHGIDGSARRSEAYGEIERALGHINDAFEALGFCLQELNHPGGGQGGIPLPWSMGRCEETGGDGAAGYAKEPDRRAWRGRVKEHLRRKEHDGPRPSPAAKPGRERKPKKPRRPGG